MTGRSRTARIIVVGAAVVLIGFGLALLVHARSQPQSMDSRVREVAATLRCPSCEAESVAASNAPIAQSMRGQVRRQLAAGRSDAQIRAWFRGRYGDQVVLLPATRGPGLVLWAVPVVVLVGGLGGWLLLRRRPSSTERGVVAGVPPRRLALAGGAFLAVGVLVPVVVAIRATPDPAPASSSLPTRTMTAADWVSVGRSLDSQQSYADAARAYRKALALSPGSTQVRTQLAFDLLRAGHPGDAEPLVRRTATRKGPERALAMLVLGLAQRAQHEPDAQRTLRAFVRLYPGHPGADQVRRLLREDR